MIKRTLAIIIFLLLGCENNLDSSKDIFRYNEYSNISSLDPAFSSTLRNIWPTHQIFNGLVRMDKNLNILPDIAEDWTISNDKKVYSFKIKDNIYFHESTYFKNGEYFNTFQKNRISFVAYHTQGNISHYWFDNGTYQIYRCDIGSRN